MNSSCSAQIGDSESASPWGRRIRRNRALWSLALLLALGLPATTWAMASDSDVDDRVERAYDAAEESRFDVLVSKLEPLIDDASTSDPRAHLLYALGLLYEADPGETDAIDEQIERALESDPALELDPLVYPPRFIDRVDEIRRDVVDPDELQRIEPEPLYIERRVERRSRLPLYLPGGTGQFYNGMPFRGVTFAAVQLLGLAANIAGHWSVESMRSASGQIPAADIDRARGWRRTQHAGIAVLLGGWIIGAVEAHLNFEPETIRIRLLEEPPDELYPEFRDRTGLPLRPGLTFQSRF